MQPRLLPRPIIGLTFFFLKNYGRHFFTQFFKYSWWVLILLLMCFAVIPYVIHDLIPEELIVENDFQRLQEYLISNVRPETVLTLFGASVLSVVLIFYLFIFTPNYYLLFTNYQTSFTYKDVMKTIKSRLSRIIIYFLASIIVLVIVSLPLYVVLLQFAGGFLGSILVPLIFGTVLLAFFLAFIEFMTVNCTIVSAFNFGFRTAVSKLGRLTINFVFLMFTSMLLTLFLQQIVMYISYEMLKVTDPEMLHNINIVSTSFTNIFMLILIYILQLYVSIGYNEFELENSIKNNNSKKDNDEHTENYS